MPPSEQPTEITGADLDQIFADFRVQTLPALLEGVRGAEMSELRIALADALSRVPGILADAGTIQSHAELQRRVCQPLSQLIRDMLPLTEAAGAAGLIAREVLRRLHVARTTARRYIRHNFHLFDLTTATPRHANLFGFGPSVEIDPEVELGTDCRIAAGASLIGTVRIGDNVTIGSNVVVMGDADAPAVIESGAVIGSDNVLEGVTINAGTMVAAGTYLHARA